MLIAVIFDLKNSDAVKVAKDTFTSMLLAKCLVSPLVFPILEVVYQHSTDNVKNLIKEQVLNSKINCQNNPILAEEFMRRNGFFVKNTDLPDHWYNQFSTKPIELTKSPVSEPGAEPSILSTAKNIVATVFSHDSSDHKTTLSNLADEFINEFESLVKSNLKSRVLAYKALAFLKSKNISASDRKINATASTSNESLSILFNTVKTSKEKAKKTTSYIDQCRIDKLPGNSYRVLNSYTGIKDLPSQPYPVVPIRTFTRLPRLFTNNFNNRELKDVDVKKLTFIETKDDFEEHSELKENKNTTSNDQWQLADIEVLYDAEILKNLAAKFTNIKWPVEDKVVYNELFNALLRVLISLTSESSEDIKAMLDDMHEISTILIQILATQASQNSIKVARLPAPRPSRIIFPKFETFSWRNNIENVEAVLAETGQFHVGQISIQRHLWAKFGLGRTDFARDDLALATMQVGSMHTLAEFFTNVKNDDISETELFNTCLLLSDHCEEHEIHDLLFSRAQAVLVSNPESKSAFLSLVKEGVILDYVDKIFSSVKTRLPELLNSSDPRTKLQGLIVCLYLLEAEDSAKIKDVIQTIVMPNIQAAEVSQKIFKSTRLQAYEFSIFKLLLVKWSKYLSESFVAVMLERYQNSSQKVVQIGMAKMIQYDVLEPKYLLQMTNSMQKIIKFSSSWLCFYLACVASLHSETNIVKSQKPILSGILSTIFQSTFHENDVINRSGLIGLSELIDFMIKARNSSLQSTIVEILNILVWEITKFDNVVTVVSLYPILFKIAALLDSDALLELVLPSLGKLLYVKDVNAAIATSTIMFSLINSTTYPKIEKYLTKKITKDKESRAFCGEELENFKNKWLVDEFQKLSLSAAYKRAINLNADCEEEELKFMKELYEKIL